MNELVQRLSQGEHPVIVGGPNPSHNEFQKRLTELGYVFIKFTDTRGGTDLGVRVDKNATVFKQVDQDVSRLVHVEGDLTLNYVKVRCIADIDLTTLKGLGHLVALDDASISLK